MAKKKTSTKKAAAPKPAKSAKPTGECPKGGSHEWIEDDGEKLCKKCLEPTPAKGKAKAAKPAKAKAAPKDKRLSAIDAAAKVLAEAKEPMNTKAMIEAMAKKGYWTSPGGKTPHATLYSAILTEITKKGKEARFKKVDRGQFALNK